MPDTSGKWSLTFIDTDAENEYDDFFKNHPNQRHCKSTYEKNVKENPFYHPVYLRIEKMEGKKWDGYFRWKKSNTKIIYYPDTTKKTIFTIETNTATQISYKKKSRR